MSKLTSIEQAEQEVLESIKFSRIIIPILIGLGVVAYLLWKQFDPEEFAKIDWSSHTLFWVLASLVFLVIRHLAYANRLRILSDYEFGWKKSIELIFIWEFSTSISPTSVGGSAVALFVLSQEKLSAAKTATIVIYSVVLDSLFFVLFIPIFVFFLGNDVIHPSLVGKTELNAIGVSFWTFYAIMLSYGSLFFYGLFVNPKQIKKLLGGVTSFGFLKRWQRKAIELGDNMILTSEDMKNRSYGYHFSAFLFTAIAWSCRFILLSCLIIAFVDISLDFETQALLYTRLKAMFILIIFSPTPGGAGFVEYVFGNFLTDFVPIGIAPVISFIWRLFAYYSYLLMGVIIVPNWLRRIIARRKLNKTP